MAGSQTLVYKYAAGSPAHHAREFIRGSRHRREAWYRLCTDWPEAAEGCERLMAYLTTSLASSGRMCVFDVLDRALNAYAEAICAEDTERLQAFFTALCDDLAELPDFHFSHQGNTWQPGSTRPAPLWLYRQIPEDIELSQAAPATFPMNAVLHQVMPQSVRLLAGGPVCCV